MCSRLAGLNTSRSEPSVGARREHYTYNRLESSPDSVIICPLPGLFVSLADTCSRALCAGTGKVVMVAGGWSLSMLLRMIYLLNARAWITTTTHAPYALARGKGTAPEAGPWHGAAGLRVKPERAAHYDAASPPSLTPSPPMPQLAIRHASSAILSLVLSLAGHRSACHVGQLVTSSAAWTKKQRKNSFSAWLSYKNFPARGGKNREIQRPLRPLQHAFPENAK